MPLDAPEPRSGSFDYVFLSTALNELGYEADCVERPLSPGDPDKIRGTYNKAMYLEPRRKMTQDWADFLEAMRSGRIQPGKFGKAA